MQLYTSQIIRKTNRIPAGRQHGMTRSSPRRRDDPEENKKCRKTRNGRIPKERSGSLASENIGGGVSTTSYCGGESMLKKGVYPQGNKRSATVGAIRPSGTNANGDVVGGDGEVARATRSAPSPEAQLA
uniref:Uncharacterized protein n=1 Tax=Steinernema glaseri TaxID=37863 RepID=A0A1I8A5Y3_9BILA